MSTEAGFMTSTERAAYWHRRCVDCHRRIGPRQNEYYVWLAFDPNSTVPWLTGPLHESHLTSYGWDRIWAWS